MRVPVNGRAAAAIAGRARVGARGVGAHAQAAVEEADGAAARSHRVDVHHGRAHANARHFRLERSLELALSSGRRAKGRRRKREKKKKKKKKKHLFSRQNGKQGTKY